MLKTLLKNVDNSALKNNQNRNLEKLSIVKIYYPQLSIYLSLKKRLKTKLLKVLHISTPLILVTN